MKSLLSAAAIAFAATTAAQAEPVKYVLDASHSQIVFDYTHLGFSTTHGMFSGFDGEIMFDQENPAASSVTVAFPVRTMLTGWQERFDHFMTADFFGAAEDEMVKFTSTGIEVTGEKTAKITGDLELNGVTKSVVLDAVLNQLGDHPMAGAVEPLPPRLDPALLVAALDRLAAVAPVAALPPEAIPRTISLAVAPSNGVRPVNRR